MRYRSAVSVQIFLSDTGQSSSKKKGPRIKDAVKPHELHKENAVAGCSIYEGLMSPRYDCFAYSHYHPVKSGLHTSTWHLTIIVGYVSFVPASMQQSFALHLYLPVITRDCLDLVRIIIQNSPQNTSNRQRNSRSSLNFMWTAIPPFEVKAAKYSMSLCTTCTRSVLKYGLPLLGLSSNLTISSKRLAKLSIPFNEIGLYGACIPFSRRNFLNETVADSPFF